MPEITIKITSDDPIRSVVNSKGEVVEPAAESNKLVIEALELLDRLIDKVSDEKELKSVELLAMKRKLERLL